MSRIYTILISLFLFIVLFWTHDPLKAALSPSMIQVYSVNDIGSAANPFQNVMPLTAAGGNIFFDSSSTPTYIIPLDTGGQPYGLFAGGNISGKISFSQKGSGSSATTRIGAGGIEAGGNVVLGTASTVTAGKLINGPISSGGNVSATNYQINGNITAAGTYTGSNTVSGTVTTGQAFTPTLNYAAVTQYFNLASTYWKNTAPNVTPIINNTLQTITVNGTTGQNVINLTLSQLNGKQINFSLPDATSSYLVINITDVATSATLNINDINATNFENTNQIIFNTPNIQNLTIMTSALTDIAGFLSPNTNLFFNDPASTVINGSLIANNIFDDPNSISNGGPTVEPMPYPGTPNFNLRLQATKPFIGFAAGEANFAVPEPSTYLIMGSLILGIAIILNLSRARREN